MRTITVEELDIIVQASVEQAITEFKKIVPQLKKTIKQVEDNLNNVESKGMVTKVQQAVQQVKQKVNEVKNTGLDKQLQTQFERAGASVEKYQSQLNQVKEKLRQVYAEMDTKQNQKWQEYTPDGLDVNKNSKVAQAIEPIVNDALANDKTYQNLSKEAIKLEQQIANLNSKLSTTKQEYDQIAGQIQAINTKQGIWENAVNKVKNSLSSLKGSAESIKKSFNGLPNITTKVNTKITQMSKGMKQGLGHVLKYAMALISMESIYGALSGIANSWLSSQNVTAQQLNANIEYLKYSLGSALAPVIQTITNLVYQLMKAIQSVIHALTGINIFANASAKAYSSMANSAKKAAKETKQLARVHDEINNIQETNPESGSSGGGSAGPNFDLSQIDSEMSPLAQKLYDFFKPLKESWDKYGSIVMDAAKNAIDGILASVSVMWQSVESIITNGTIYSILANILNAIGAIGQAWANAWTNDNNGTEVIQGIANMINDITQAILNLVSSTGFQNFLDGILSALSGIVQFLEPVISGFSEMLEVILEIVMSTIGNLLTIIGNALQSIAQNEIASAVLEAIGAAIAIIVSAIVLWNAAQLILNGLIGIFTALTSPITLIILAIVAAITAIILVIQNWGSISQWFGDLWISITTTLQEVWNNVKEFFINCWQGICEAAIIIWTAISDFFSSIWNGIKEVATNIWNGITTTISNVINGIKDTIQNVLNTIKAIWDNIWNGLKSTVTNIFNSIWNSIRNVINSILGGIEGMANGIVKGINAVIRVLNNLSFDIPDWIPGFGGKKFGFNISQLSTISLPRLAKGAVLKTPTIAEVAEYPGASQNPEIVTPQNIMEETFDRVMAKYEDNNSGQPIYLTVKVGNKKLGQILLEDLRNIKRRSGNGIEALIGG